MLTTYRPAKKKARKNERKERRRKIEGEREMEREAASLPGGAQPAYYKLNEGSYKVI